MARAKLSFSAPGCFLSLDGDGRLCVERGYVRAEDEPRS